MIKMIDIISNILIFSVAIFCFFVWPVISLGSQIPHTSYPKIVVFLKEWQDLLAGMLAIAAAFWATRPVWHQLNVSKIQAAAEARTVLKKNLAEIEERKSYSEKILESITTDFMRVICPYDYDQEPDINPNWAWDAAHTLGIAERKFQILQSSRIDSAVVERARGALICDIDLLSDCLNTINVATGADHGLYDDEGITDEDRVRINAESDLAERQLVNRIRSVGASGRELDRAFNEEIKSLLSRIRQMDDIVINASLISK